MFEQISRLIKTKEGRQLVTVLGVTVLSLTAFYYYHQIKLTRMKISEMEKELDSHKVAQAASEKSQNEMLSKKI